MPKWCQLGTAIFVKGYRLPISFGICTTHAMHVTPTMLHSQHPSHVNQDIDYIEYFAGTGNLSKCMKAAKYKTTRLDLKYHDVPKNSKRSNYMDLNSGSGFAFLWLYYSGVIFAHFDLSWRDSVLICSQCIPSLYSSAILPIQQPAFFLHLISGWPCSSWWRGSWAPSHATLASSAAAAFAKSTLARQCGVRAQP